MRQKTAKCALAAACILLLPLLAQAQDNAVRRPVTTPEESPDFGPPPVALKFKTKAQQPAPAQGATDDEPRPGRFPNIDTAKDRRDYEMSTSKAGGLSVGRDEDTGDTVMGATPPKKKAAADPYASQPNAVPPIIVRPRIRY